jgi:hypothetical protein
MRGHVGEARSAGRWAGRTLRAAGALAALALLASPAAALAHTETARSGQVSASFTYTGHDLRYKDGTLTIRRAGHVVYSHRVSSKSCGSSCIPASANVGDTSVQVLNLEHSGNPDVLLALFSGGSHCCSIVQVFSPDAHGGYVKTEHNFGDPGESIVDLGHNGRLEFLTADDTFAYAFTDYAASGLPIQILTFSQGRFHNVTRSYPRLIARDAAAYLKVFKSMARDHYSDSTGIIAAWAADEDLLGHAKLVSRYLNQQAAAGHLNSALAPEEPSGRRFIAALNKFLRREGYLR